MTIKEQCEQYLRYKYEYYILATPSISDYEFDVFETDLKKTGDKLAIEVTDIVDFPSLMTIERLGLNLANIAPNAKIKRDDSDHPHTTLMLSTQKIKVEDEDNMPLNEVSLFLNRTSAPYIEASPKYDGNGIEVIYENFKLKQILTRGDKEYGKDKTNKLSLLVPSTIPFDGLIEIRGEMVTEIKYWEDNFSRNDPDNPDNPRNWVAGVISTEQYDFKELNALTFIAFSLVRVTDGKKEYIEDSMNELKRIGFNANHEPLITKIHGVKDFRKLYFDYKDYRENCEFLLDGIVLKYPENLRNQLGENNKEPKWNTAIKFKPEKTVTTIIDIEWSYGKNQELTPIAILKPVELLGTMVTRCSLHNLGFVITKEAFPGATISLVKSGDIIPRLVEVIEKSPLHDEYMKEFNNFNNK